MYKSFAVLFLAVFPSALYAQVNGITGEVKHHFIITGNDINKIFIVNKSGKTEWEAETKGESYEVTMLPNGNILFPYRWGCALMNRGKEILWDFSSPKEKEQEIHAVQPFCREYDKKGKLLWEFASPFNCYSAVRLKKGNTLIGCGDGHLVL